MLQHHRRTDALLQSVQNAAARLVTGTRRYDHNVCRLCFASCSTGFLYVLLKIATLVYRFLSSSAQVTWLTTVTVRSLPTPVSDNCVLPTLKWERIYTADTTNQTHAAVFVTWRCKDSSPGVHLQSPGLLQFGDVRRHRQLTSTTAVCTERCSQVNYADWSPWTHLTWSAGIALAACSTPRVFQTGSADVQVATRLRTVVSLRRVQVSIWGQSLSPLVWRHHMRHTVVQNSSDVTGPRLWNKLPAGCFIAVIWQPLPVQKTVENVFVC